LVKQAALEPGSNLAPALPGRCDLRSFGTGFCLSLWWDAGNHN
jgi:hypothetical protein